MQKLLFLAAILLFSLPAAARDMPYYASIKSDEANIRSGPSVRYPILWLYKRHSWPVQITATFERWRKISDIHGEVGWIHESLLSNKRYVLIKTDGSLELYRLPLLTAAKVAIVENGVIAELQECKNEWCKVQAENIEGWVESKNLWGVNKYEVVE